jgi:hypothetical protein
VYSIYVCVCVCVCVYIYIYIYIYIYKHRIAQTIFKLWKWSYNEPTSSIIWSALRCLKIYRCWSVPTLYTHTYMITYILEDQEGEKWIYLIFSWNFYCLVWPISLHTPSKTTQCGLVGYVINYKLRSKQS